MYLALEDNLRLAADVDLDPAGRVLVDHSLHTSHGLNDTGVLLADHLRSGARPQDLSTCLMNEFGVDAPTARRDYLAFLVALDQEALLHVSRPWRTALRPTVLAQGLRQAVLIGSDESRARRFPGTASGVLRAVLAVVSWPLILMAVATALFPVLLQSAQPDTPMSTHLASAGYLVALLLILVVTMWLHEYGHVVALHRQGGGPLVMVVRGYRIGVVHRRQPDVDYGVVAVSGPALACAGGLGLALLALLPVTPAQAFLLAPLIGAAHLVSLAPFAADGKMLVAALRERREAIA